MKTALIIGGNSGMGKATALQLAAEGVEVHIVGRTTSKLNEAKSEIEKVGKVIVHQVNISNTAEVNAFIDTLNSIIKIDYLVNASGIFGPKPFLDHTLEDYDSYLD
jgi:NAD(P)-dependent dehydrogenase (short-subunit alcohol dehydrogenase family)